MDTVTKLSPRREQFAMEFVATGNASEAYRRAYPRACNWQEQSVHVNASKFLSNAEVQLRVEQLREEAINKHGVTIESVLQEYDEAIKLAKDNRQAAAMIAAITKKAELFGLFDKHQRKGKEAQRQKRLSSSLFPLEINSTRSSSEGISPRK